MPKTAKGLKILAAMKRQYGEKKGTSVFYASRNKGTITGVDATFNAQDCIARFIASRATRDAFQETQHPRSHGKFARKGMGAARKVASGISSAASSVGSTVGGAAQGAARRVGSAASAVGGAARNIASGAARMGSKAAESFGGEEHQVLREHLAQVTPEHRSKIARGVMAAAKSVPGLIKSKINEERHHAVHAAKGLHALVKGQKLSPEQKSGLRNVGGRLVMTGLSTAFGDPSGAVGHAAGSALGHVASAFGHDAVQHVLIEHALKSMTGAGLLLRGRFKKPQTGDALDDLSPEDIAALQRFVAALAGAIEQLDPDAIMSRIKAGQMGDGAMSGSGDAAMGSEAEPGVGAESWVGSRKNTTGYRINAADARARIARFVAKQAGDAGLPVPRGLSQSGLHGYRSGVDDATHDAQDPPLETLMDKCMAKLMAKSPKYSKGTSDAFEETAHPRGKHGQFTYHSSLTGTSYRAPEKAHTRSGAHNQAAILSRRTGEGIEVRQNGQKIASFLRGFATWKKPDTGDAATSDAFEETAHPRGEGGKFSKGPGGEYTGHATTRGGRTLHTTTGHPHHQAAAKAAALAAPKAHSIQTGRGYNGSFDMRWHRPEVAKSYTSDTIVTAKPPKPRTTLGRPAPMPANRIVTARNPRDIMKERRNAAIPETAAQQVRATKPTPDAPLGATSPTPPTANHSAAASWHERQATHFGGSGRRDLALRHTEAAGLYHKASAAHLGGVVEASRHADKAAKVAMPRMMGDRAVIRGQNTRFADTYRSLMTTDAQRAIATFRGNWVRTHDDWLAGSNAAVHETRKGDEVAEPEKWSHDRCKSTFDTFVRDYGVRGMKKGVRKSVTSTHASGGYGPGLKIGVKRPIHATITDPARPGWIEHRGPDAKVMAR